jgi:hypothetical protein
MSLRRSGDNTSALAVPLADARGFFFLMGLSPIAISTIDFASVLASIQLFSALRGLAAIPRDFKLTHYQKCPTLDRHDII